MNNSQSVFLLNLVIKLLGLHILAPITFKHPPPLIPPIIYYINIYLTNYLYCQSFF